MKSSPLNAEGLSAEQLGLQLLKEGRPSLRFAPWAHQRVFALACYGNFAVPAAALKRLKGPLAWLWYRPSSLALVRMLEHLEKNQQGARMLRLSRLCPPLFIWAFEQRLGRLIRARIIQGGAGFVSNGPTKASKAPHPAQPAAAPLRFRDE